MSETITLKDGREVTPVNNSTIHHMYVLDRSRSMDSNNRYPHAIGGINDEAELLKKQNDGLKETFSVIEFDSVKENSERIVSHYFMTPIDKIEHIDGAGPSGNTPLYQAVGYVIEKALRKANKNDKVLIKIFTDGEHNCKWGKYTKESLNELIKDVQDNHDFTVTFVGLKEDVESAIKHLGIDRGNTYTYDGSEKGTKRAFASLSDSTMTYRENLKSGKMMKAKFFENQEKQGIAKNV